MYNILVKTTSDAYDEHGLGVAITTAILLLAVIFGLWCGVAALFMVCWNWAVVPAIAVCSTMGFWQSFVFCLAFDCFFVLALPSKSKE